jgi:hypothetical protein
MRLKLMQRSLEPAGAGSAFSVGSNVQAGTERAAEAGHSCTDVPPLTKGPSWPFWLMTSCSAASTATE